MAPSTTMKAVIVPGPNQPFEIVHRPIPVPGKDEVLIKVQACGVCHSDCFVAKGQWPGIQYPRVPGHEVIGVIAKRGENVGEEFKEGTTVGVGWHGGHCGSCESCRKGDFITCQLGLTTGISYDGGYAEYLVAPKTAVAFVPNGLKAEEAAPLLCAGVTVFNSLRHMNIHPGSTVAVQGVGGLGHLAIQYAAKAGFKVVALSSGQDKEALAKKLGAHHYVNTSHSNYIDELKSFGGFKLIMATAPYASAINPLVQTLGVNGQLLVLAAAETPISVNPVDLIMRRASIRGWPSGHAKDSEDTLQVSVIQGVKPIIETFPLEKAEEAYKKMMDNKARFRAVLVTGH